MAVFSNSFDHFKTVSDSFSSNIPLAEWGQDLDLPVLAEQLTPLSTPDIVADNATQTIPEYSATIDSGPFGTTGSDGDSFYYFDPDSGASVML